MSNVWSGGGRVSPSGQQTRKKFRDTPARLTAQSNTLAVLLVIWALASIATLALLRGSATNARRAADQVSRVQETSIRLTRADSLATSGFLNGGLQSDAALAEFAKDIREANASLAVIYRGPGGQELANANLEKEPDQRRAGWAIKSINDYQADVTSAQANNRQGFPVGATYQKTASNLMRTDILDPLDRVGNQARAELLSSTDGFILGVYPPVWFILFAAVPIILGLLGLSRRTQRTLNLPVVAGLGLAFVATLMATTLTRSALGDVTNFVTGDFRDRDLVTQSRVALYNAKANESLTLIARGSGQSYEQQWRQNMADFNERQSRQEYAEARAYVVAHQRVRELDDGGNWDEAKKLVLPENNTDTSNPRFAALDARLSDQLAAIPERPPLKNHFLFLAQWIIGLSALGAAALVRIGYRQRVREYQ